MFAAMPGEFAALGTACCWAASYILFTLAVRIAGPKWLNRWRLTVAAVLLLVVHGVAFGRPLPLDAGWGVWGWLTLSGVIGFAISDAFLFRALYHIGAHRTSLVTSLIPVISTAMAWIVFGETMSWTQLLASAGVVAGIALVVSARSPGRRDAANVRQATLGILFALGTVVTQSARYILSKKALAHAIPALSANVVQIVAAAAAVWIAAFAGGRWKNDLEPFSDPRAAGGMIGGAIAGPFIGVTLSMVALSYARVGIASTLMALQPVLLLPFAALVLKERIGVRAIAGTALAVGGVACLFLF